MRNQYINQRYLWVVEPLSTAPLLDDDGFDTGEKITTFSTPTQIKLTLYPSNGAIIEQLFGKDSRLDMVAISTDVELTKDSLLFVSEPVSDFEKTYTYSVSEIKRGLNTFQYGLNLRVQ